MSTQGTAPRGDRLQVLNVVISSPEKRGGAIRAGLQLGDHLATYVDVDTVKMRGDYDDLLADELDLDHEFQTTPARTLLRDIGKLIVSSRGNYENTTIWTELSTPRPLSGYDVVHFHNATPLWGLLAATIRCRFADVPYVVTTHGISKIPELPRSMEMSRAQSLVFDKAFLKPYKYVLGNAEHLLALSESDDRRLNELFPDVPTTVVPNGVSPNVREIDPGAVGLDLPEDEPMLLFVGKVTGSKGVGDLLDAYRRLDSECTLVVVGEPTEDHYVELLREDDEVRYPGYVDQETLRALYRRADLFVFPTRSDVFPLVTLEAMAAETPVVSTNVGGIPEQITEATGVLVPPREPGVLAKSVSELLEDESRRSTMSEMALARVEDEFSWDGVARKTVDVYERVCRQEPKT